ncbi:hypothetical protein ACHWQZ_G008395 [Mnemiopsis leidyi]
MATDAKNLCKNPEKESNLGETTISCTSPAEGNTSPLKITSLPPTASDASQNSECVNQDTEISILEIRSSAKSNDVAPVVNVVQDSLFPDSQESLDFEESSEDLPSHFTSFKPEYKNVASEDNSEQNDEITDKDDQVIVSPKLLKAVINCVPRTLPEHVVRHFKGDAIGESSRKRKLNRGCSSTNEIERTNFDEQVESPDSVNRPNSGLNQMTKMDIANKRVKTCDSTSSNSHCADVDVTSTASEGNMIDKSTELKKSDKFYDIKRIIMQATRTSTGVNLQRFRQFSNIFLKNWRFSKQFSRNASSRSKHIILNTLGTIVKDLYENDLITIKGPEDSVDVIKMMTDEIKQDHSRIFSQTPPTLTVLITADLFDKYHSDSIKGPLSATKRGSGKSVNLGSVTSQWMRLKGELGMETNEEVASILIHCYKAWISVACSKCRRHMEVGMEQKSGRKISNSETSVCIVSCDCGKSTSGGFMIECDICHKWQHGFCVNVDKDNIPDSYSCSWCRKIRGKMELSAEDKQGEESDDSVVSIDNTELCSTDDSEPEVIELD